MRSSKFDPRRQLRSVTLNKKIVAGLLLVAAVIFLASVIGGIYRLPYDPDCDLTTQVRQSIASSLEHLGVTRIDSYILHGPSRSSGLGQADWETWRAMEDAVDEGLVGLLGISNVSVDQLDALLGRARIRPAFVQNRCLARASGMLRCARYVTRRASSSLFPTF